VVSPRCYQDQAWTRRGHLNDQVSLTSQISKQQGCCSRWWVLAAAADTASSMLNVPSSGHQLDAHSQQASREAGRLTGWQAGIALLWCQDRVLVALTVLLYSAACVQTLLSCGLLRRCPDPNRCQRWLLQ
jgi:hypothetical protein